MQCRLCLSQLDKNGRPLFDDTEKHAFLEIIINFLQLGPKLCDDISITICQECWQYLDDFYKFCKNIEKQQNTLHQELATVKTEPELEKAAVDIELSATSGTDPIDTNEETFVDIKDILINGVESILNEAQDEEFACANMEEETLEHTEDSCEDDIPLKKLRATKLIKKTLKSKKCNLSKQKKPKDKNDVVKRTVKKIRPKLKSDSSVENSKEKADELRKCEEYLTAKMLLKCELCDVTTPTFALLLKHFRIKHNSRGYIKCCEREIKNRTFLVDHVNYHLNPNRYQCKICNMCYKSKYNLNGHMVIAHPKAEQLKYECSICGKGFAIISRYEAHLEEHQTERKFICEICKKGFTTKNCMATHRRIMHNTATFICNYCGREYRSKAYFEDHVAKHEGNYVETSIKCTVCNSWLKKSSMPSHMEKHRPVDITCELCQRICHTRRAYLVHMRTTHSNLYKFPCTFCDKKFKQKKNLEEHIAMHTGEKNNICRYCSKEFRSKANMYAHIKRDHVAEWMESKLQKVQRLEQAASAVNATT